MRSFFNLCTLVVLESFGDPLNRRCLLLVLSSPLWCSCSVAFLKNNIEVLLKSLFAGAKSLSTKDVDALSFLIQGGASQGVRAAALSSLCPAFTSSRAPLEAIVVCILPLPTVEVHCFHRCPLPSFPSGLDQRRLRREFSPHSFRVPSPPVSYEPGCIQQWSLEPWRLWRPPLPRLAAIQGHSEPRLP